MYRRDFHCVTFPKRARSSTKRCIATETQKTFRLSILGYLLSRFERRNPRLDFRGLKDLDIGADRGAECRAFACQYHARRHPFENKRHASGGFGGGRDRRQFERTRTFSDGRQNPLAHFQRLKVAVQSQFDGSPGQTLALSVEQTLRDERRLMTAAPHHAARIAGFLSMSQYSIVRMI